MNEERSSASSAARSGLAVVAVLIVAALALAWLTDPGSGPAPIAWDREACAFCRMHIGDRGFAAQLQPQEGEPVSFDDPGCLFLYIDDRSPRVANVYFRHEAGDRWLTRDEVAFRVDVEHTPMGFGLAATSAQTPGALSMAEAHSWLRKRQAAK